MARVNIHLPDDLARRAREAGLNVSGIARAALEQELGVRATDTWLDSVLAEPPLARLALTHEDVIAALDEVRSEAGDEFPPGYDRDNA